MGPWVKMLTSLLYELIRRMRALIPSMQGTEKSCGWGLC
jgi:hypothetical protein